MTKSQFQAKHQPAVGRIVNLAHEGGAGRWATIQECSWWDGCELALPTTLGEDYPVAVTIETTGRTLQIKEGVPVVRIRIGWLNDDEPTVYTGGWLRVGW